MSGASPTRERYYGSLLFLVFLALFIWATFSLGWGLRLLSSWKDDRENVEVKTYAIIGLVSFVVTIILTVLVALTLDLLASASRSGKTLFEKQRYVRDLFI